MQDFKNPERAEASKGIDKSFYGSPANLKPRFIFLPQKRHARSKESSLTIVTKLKTKAVTLR